jgi:hypothetical protein
MFSSELTLSSCDRLQLSKPQNRTISHGVTVATDPVQGHQLVSVSVGWGGWKTVLRVFLFSAQMGQACKEHISLYNFFWGGYLSSRHLGYVYCKLIFLLIPVCYSHFPFQ